MKVPELKSGTQADDYIITWITVLICTKYTKGIFLMAVSKAHIKASNKYNAQNYKKFKQI